MKEVKNEEMKIEQTDIDKINEQLFRNNNFIDDIVEKVRKQIEAKMAYAAGYRAGIRAKKQK